jgi:vesicle transport protein SEC22
MILTLLTCSYLIQDSVVFLCICDQSYPRKLAFTYLADLASEFTTTYPSQQYLSAVCRPYAFVEFDTFIQKTKKTYQDARATSNLDKIQDELKDVTKIMTKNIEDLLYRGDSLERMGEMSGRLREDSRKYKRAAVRINWELLMKMVSFLFFGFANIVVWSICGSWVYNTCILHLEVLVEMSFGTSRILSCSIWGRAVCCGAAFWDKSYVAVRHFGDELYLALQQALSV